MKKWNLKVKGNPKGIIKKLDASFGSVDGFVFRIVDDKDDSVLFKIRKRMLFSHQILQNNRIIVNGKILKRDTENADVQISFTQHFLIAYAIIEVLLFIMGLIVIVSGLSFSTSIYILGGTVLAAGVGLWIALQRKLEKDIQRYKKLISEILEL